MKNIIVTLLVLGALLLLLPGSSSAQYYGYYSPYFDVPPPRPMGPPPQATLSYRLRADPYLYWRWEHHNAFSDHLQYQRSPLNPESDLSYMLRTF